MISITGDNLLMASSMIDLTDHQSDNLMIRPTARTESNPHFKIFDIVTSLESALRYGYRKPGELISHP
ncbi:hypothetical protein D3C80_1969640 [compost metagenome]